MLYDCLAALHRFIKSIGVETKKNVTVNNVYEFIIERLNNTFHIFVKTKM